MSVDLLVSTDLVGYTLGMKTAVSVPDVVFRKADRYARRKRKSRSQLYAEALVEYLDRHDSDAVTEAMNKALADLGEEAVVDPVIMAATKRLMRKESW